MSSIKQVTRTTEGLRDILFDELDGFLDGKFDTEHAKTVTTITGSILNTVQKDLEAVKMLNIMNQGRDQPKAVADLALNLILTSHAKKGELKES